MGGVTGYNGENILSSVVTLLPGTMIKIMVIIIMTLLPGAMIVIKIKIMVIIRMTLLPGASTWTPLTSLPRGRFSAQVSIVGGALRLIGGDDDVGNSVLDEVRYRKINL